MIKEQRRRYPRKTLNPLPHIHLPCSNGGIVLDVSEQGLRFRAIAPVEQSGPIVFSFTSHSSLVAGTGELVWIDQAKKTGGLRFTELPYNALEQIRKWPHDSDVQLGISNDLTLHIPARGESPSSFTAQITAALEGLLPASFRSKLRKSWIPALGKAVAQLHAIFPAALLPKLNRRLFKTACALSLGIVIPTLVYVRHREVGALLVRLGAGLSGQVNTLALAPAIASVGPRVDDGTVSASKVDRPVAQAVPESVSAATATTSKDASPGTAAHPAQETAARVPKSAVRGRELVVQVAALKEEADARELTDRLRKENFEAFVGTLPIDAFYRVMLGPYPDEASARVVLGKLKRAGFNSFIRRESAAERLGS
jgi:hypothetical protein